MFSLTQLITLKGDGIQYFLLALKLIMGNIIQTVLIIVTFEQVSLSFFVHSSMI